MFTTNVRRGVVALATAFAILALMGTPASAHPFVILSGTINVGTQNFTFPSEEEDKCTENPIIQSQDQVIDITFSGTSGSGTWTARNWDDTPNDGINNPRPIKARFRLDPPNDAQYWQADISILTGAGTYAAGGTAPWTHTLASSAPNHVTLEIRLYRLDPAADPTCPKTDLACTIRTRVQVNTGSRASVPGMPTVATGDDVELTLTNVINTFAITPCPATIQSQLVGKAVSGNLVLEAL